MVNRLTVNVYLLTCGKAIKWFLVLREISRTTWMEINQRNVSHCVV